MIIDIPDDEYPELVNYLSDAKRKMKFLYFLETSFEENGYDPTLAGIRAKRMVETPGTMNVDLTSLTSHLDLMNNTLQTLTKNLDGACIGRFPVEHVVHETVVAAPRKASVEEDEIDYSDPTGIDFSAAIAAFDD